MDISNLMFYINFFFLFCTIKAPHCIHMRNGVKFGDTSLTDTMMCDGLTDTFNQYHMGITGKIWRANQKILPTVGL